MTTRLPIADEIPDELLAYTCWLCWRMETRDGKPTKVPYSHTGGGGSSTDKRTWTSFAKACKGAAAQGMDGVGFVLTEPQELIGIDLDKCVIDGKPDEWAQGILCRFPDTYAEITPSGTGIRIFLKGKLPDARGRKNSKIGEGRVFEIYSTGRYLTVTGNRLPKRPLSLCEGGEELATLYTEMFPPEPGKPVKTAQKRVVEPLDMTAEELLQRAFASANGAAIESLWNGDLSGHNGDHSAADCALCAHLAFWAGPSGEDTVDRIFRQSALYRPKWDTKHRNDGATYGQMTIEQAYRGVSEYYAGESDAVELPTPLGKKGRCVNASGEMSTEVSTQENEAIYVQNEAKNEKCQRVNTVNASAEKEEKEADWPAICPVRDNVMQPFPIQALPAEIADYVEEVARFIHVPLDMAALCALATLSFAVCRRFDAEITTSYVEPANLFVAITAEPGSRKSSTLEAMVFPLRHAEIDLSLDGAEELAAMKERRQAQESLLRRKRDEAGKIEDAEKRERAIEEITKMAEQLQAVPTAPRLLVEDVTPERIVGLLLEQSGTLALISSEGGIFQMMGGRYAANGESNLDVFLKAHDAESYRVDRMGRLPEFLPAARLMLCVMVQPNVLHSLSAKKEFRGRGVLGRFLFGVPADMRGVRLMSLSDAGVSFEKRMRYGSAMRTLLRYPAKNAGNLFEHYNIALSNEARAIHVEGANDVERRQGPGGDLRDISDWASKLAGKVVRIAACLHAWKYREDRPENVRVDELTMLQAWAIGAYLIEHAKKAFDMMSESDLARVVKSIADWIEDKQITEFTARDCHRALQRRVKGAKEIEEALDILSLNNHVRKVETRNASGRRVFSWEVNPEIFARKPLVF